MKEQEGQREGKPRGLALPPITLASIDPIPTFWSSEFPGKTGKIFTGTVGSLQIFATDINKYFYLHDQ